MVKRIFPAETDALAQVTAFAEEELEKLDCPMKIILQFDVCIEEIFVNIAHYAYGEGKGDAEITMDFQDGVVSFTFADSGVEFDPLAKPDPDVTLSAEGRDAGGLGIFMVKKSMDSVEYKRENGRNIFTMAKKIV